MHSKNIAYRPDIDGLRAIAVLLVLLFHFELGVPGGFIGVDVFFVISGFLITEVIRNAVTNKKFSFIDFYTRRVIRLHPALLATIAACLCAGFIFMDPASFSSLAKSAQYSLFSASNFYFWLNQGYFDESAQTQPLLHTWSLAAEWQFYIVWPLVIWAALKISDRFLLILLAAMTTASLVGSQLMLSYDSSAAYFMMPFRVFELSIGALVVFFAKHRASGTIESGIVAIGVILLAVSAFWLDATSPFPGARALLPCLGAAACIYAGRARAGAILRNGLMVRVGLISYSVYLVHWPILVIYKYYIFRNVTLPEKIILLAVSIIAGALLYVTVERPFMSKVRHARHLGVAAIAASVAIGSYSIFLVIDHKGMYSRVPKEFLSLVSDPENYHINNYGGHGYELETLLGDANGKRIAVMTGDSFALQYASGIDKDLRERNYSISGVFRHGCILSTEYTRILNNVPRQDCKDAYQNALNQLNGNNLPLIIAQHWGGYEDIVADHNGKNTKDKGITYTAVIEDLLLRARNEIGNRALFIVGSQPYLPGKMNVSSCLLRPSYVTQHCEKLLQYSLSSSASYQINAVLKKFAESHPNTFYLDPSPAFCKNDNCESVRDGKIFYSDGSHLSVDGSIIASKKLLSEMFDSY